MKNPWVIIGVITIVLFGGAIWYADSAAKKNNEGVVINQNIKGNENAAVTLVEYSDLQCPACASFHPVVNDVIDQFGDDLRFEYKHYPLPIHSFAVQAAVAAEAAGQQGKFFEFHDLLFENQSTWSSAVSPNTFFLQYAEELDLDIEIFRRHMNSSLLREKVRDEQSEARGLGITGTPTFFLNGQRMQIQTFQDFVTQIATAIDPQSGAGTSTESAPTNQGQGVRFGI